MKAAVEDSFNWKKEYMDYSKYIENLLRYVRKTYQMSKFCLPLSTKDQVTASHCPRAMCIGLTISPKEFQ